MNGYYRVMSAVPSVCVGDVGGNCDEIAKIMKEAQYNGVHVLLLPELCLTGLSCGDLFLQKELIKQAAEGLFNLRQSAGNMLTVVGLPWESEGRLYNVAAFLHEGKILGLWPKLNLSVNERRYFSDVPPEWALPSINFEGISMGLCWGFNESQAKEYDLALIFGSEPDYLGLRQSNKDYAKALSRKNNMAVLFCSPGAGESTTDGVYSGDGFVCDRGEIGARTVPFSLTTETACYDLDFGITNNPAKKVTEQSVTLAPPVPFDMGRRINRNPFLPEDKQQRNGLLEDILEMTVTALARRFAHVNAKRLVIGVSGGLDSTMALVICVKAAEKLGLGPKTVLAVTMPGFGTSNTTVSNARALMDGLGVESREISIKAACEQHFREIGHSGSPDLTFENAQARERTQILLDLANMENGIVVGTGDMTELALGFATYNGDHMSSYGVNGGLPKTVIRALVEYLGETSESDMVGAALLSVATTPISPELLPPDAQGKIAQKTEEIVGPYELNDFFLYYVVKHKLAKDRLLAMTRAAFGLDEKTAADHLDNFYRRFISQQFKRSCLPDGPAVFDFSLSPRGGLVMPSDACNFFKTT